MQEHNCDENKVVMEKSIAQQHGTMSNQTQMYKTDFNCTRVTDTNMPKTKIANESCLHDHGARSFRNDRHHGLFRPSSSRNR